jgi:hypothetical protein
VSLLVPLLPFRAVSLVGWNTGPIVERNAQFESLDGFAISSAEVIQLSVDQ